MDGGSPLQSPPLLSIDPTPLGFQPATQRVRWRHQCHANTVGRVNLVQGQMLTVSFDHTVKRWYVTPSCVTVYYIFDSFASYILTPDVLRALRPDGRVQLLARSQAFPQSLCGMMLLATMAAWLTPWLVGLWRFFDMCVVIGLDDHHSGNIYLLDVNTLEPIATVEVPRAQVGPSLAVSSSLLCWGLMALQGSRGNNSSVYLDGDCIVYADDFDDTPDGPPSGILQRVSLPGLLPAPVAESRV